MKAPAKISSATPSEIMAKVVPDRLVEKDPITTAETAPPTKPRTGRKKVGKAPQTPPSSIQFIACMHR